MSNGALTQLAAIGAQDTNFLSNDCKDSIFKEVDKKITNFARSNCSMIPLGNSSWGNTFKFKVQKKGDLLSTMYLSIELPKITGENLYINDMSNGEYFFRWSNYIGNVLIKNIKLYIGGQLIDEQTGEFQQIFTDLYDDDWNKLCLLGMDENLTEPARIKKSGLILDSNYLYIPIKFWFCNSLSKALPIIALQYHDIEVEVTLRDWKDCFIILKKETNPLYLHNDQILVNMRTDDTFRNLKEIPLGDIKLDCNFIYLDSVERKKVAQSEHKILITQSQKINCSVSQTKSVELNLNHPVKELFYFFSSEYFESGYGEVFNFSNKPEYLPKFAYDYILAKNAAGSDLSESDFTPKKHVLGEARILINTHPRVDWHDYKYYFYLQNYENYRNKLEHYAYLYSFSGNPKAQTPMGSLNFSRIDNSQLQIKLNSNSLEEFQKFLPDNKKYLLQEKSFTTNVYAVNYNYLIIKGGMAGLEFSN